MNKKFLIGLTIFFYLVPNAFAKQFSECSPSNTSFLHDQLNNVQKLYPQNIQTEITATNNFEADTDHNYGQEKIVGRFIFKGTERVQGIMVNYFFHKREKDLPQFAQDIKTMKAQGVIGISLEVPWYEYETQDDVFTPPIYIEKALEIIESNGLYATVLLSPHYTPDWFFQKLGDIYMHRPDQTPIIWDNLRTLVPEAGAYMTYSPFAEKAIQEQIAFDVNATQHYENHPSVIAIFLSNEQTYPKEIPVDYSSYAAQAWNTHQHTINKPLPTDKSSTDYRQFEYFLQDGLNSFHHQVISAVQAQQKTTVPVTDRLLLYESMSDNAYKYHQRPLKMNDTSTVVANDMYGYTPNVFALQYSYEKPIIIAETNMLGTCDSSTMYDYIMLQFLNGSSIISVFKWQRGADEYSLLNPDGSIKDRAKGVFDAAKKIQSLKDLFYPPIQKSFSLNRDDILDEGEKGNRVDSDSAIEYAWENGLMPAIYWTDDQNNRSEKNESAATTILIYFIIALVLGGTLVAIIV